MAIIRFISCLIFCVLVWAGGFLWFVTTIPSSPANSPRADLIVILTGGAGRLDYGLELLADKRAKAVFISGVSKAVTVKDVINLASKETQKKLSAIKNPSIFLGNRAVNTIGNAEETKLWLEGKPYKDIILVTSNYHMPRSLNEFHNLLPSRIIIAAPVVTKGFDIKNWLRDPKSQRRIFSEYHKFIASKLRHLFISVTQAT